uniref:Aminopeptidase N n=1 Tax=Timema cristinae TaxID=61476 RepID=A0A7R9CJR3_TIMCR|nr:unnamed protein product [Timema cristinae]
MDSGFCFIWSSLTVNWRLRGSDLTHVRRAEANDLFKALEEQYKEDFPNPELSDEELQDVFESWTLQMGYPVITVTRDYALGTVNVNQERFLLTNSSSTDVHDYKWWVPLTFTTKTEKDFTDTATKEWLKRTEENKQLTTLTPVTSDWVLFNIQQTGFYRVNYDTTNWKLLISQLNSDQYEVIPPVNRAQLLDDAFNLARAGLLDYSILFSLTDYLARETDYIPWYAAFNGFSFLNTRLNKAPDSEYSVFKNYVLSLLEKVYTTLGFEEKTTDGHVDRLNRNLILTWACRLGHADCIQKATQHFNAFVSDQNANKVAPDLQSVVYCNGLGNSDGAGFDVLWEKAQSTDVSTEQVLILGILGCTAHEDSAHKYINQSYSEETPIRQQDISLVLSSVTSYGNVDFLTSYIQKHYQDRSPSQVRSLISSAANLLRSEDQFSKLEDFVQSNKVYLDVTDEQATSLLSSYHSNKAWATTTGSTILTQMKQQIYRLPTTISPVNYVIRLTPHLEEDRFNFDGEVTITINVAEYTNQIVLHASDMVVDTAATQVTHSDGTVQTISSHETNELRETYTITLVDSLVVGQQYNVYIKFLGNLRDDMYGFYRSYYTVGGADSSERLYGLSPVRWLASTQFESTYARRAFPCFDEPALKATFQINIGRSSTYTSVSNMKIERTDTSDPNLVWDIYQTTPVMSTYLLAFLVSDFEKTENDAQDTSVWHRADAASQASYSIGVSRPLIDAMVTFTGVTFELEKMDQAAIPDFSAGAMENWGLVTYRYSLILVIRTFSDRERLILFDETVSTSADKQGIATTIAHEFAHQWFGNLVSPRWWSYAWLNEGFATYFEWFITAEVEKDWRIEDQFVIKEVQVALAADCLESSHPMTNLVNSPADISSIFDSISYAKAGSVIRMMSHFLSTSIFKAGLNTYLNTHHHNTAEASDLFTALHTTFLTVNPSSEISVIDVMNTWTTQMGYPVITVNRNYDTGRTAKVKQERFLLTTSADSSDDHDYKWWIPLTFTTNASKDFTTTQTQIWLKASENEIDLTDIAANDDWVIFNKQQIGFYRVNYDDTNWNLIISHLNSDQFTDIHVLNRAQLLDDSLSLARAGILDYTTALNITKYLSREDDYIPWYSAFTAFSFLDARLIGVEEEYQLFKKIASPSNVTIPADVSSVVYCTALREGGEEEWTFLKAQYDSSNVGTEQVLLLTALGCSTGTQIITNYLDLSISAESGIRKQDASRVFSAVYANPSGVDIAFQFLTENYQKISEFYGGLGTIGSILKGIAARISTQEQLIKLQSFVAENEAALGDAVTASKQAIETAQANLDWVASNRAALVTWLREQSPATPEVTTLFTPTTTQGATCITISTTLIVLASLSEMLRVSTAIILTCLSCTLSSAHLNSPSSSSNDTTASTQYRLPGDVIPRSYVIKLIPKLYGDFVFNGTVEMTTEVVENTETITFHIDDLEIDEDSVVVRNLAADITVDVTNQTFDEVHNFYTLTLKQELEKGNEYNIFINYNGHHRDDMRGFYRSSYVNSTGDTV